MVQLTAFFTTALLSGGAYAAASWFPKAGATWNIQLKSSPTAKQADNAAYAIWDMDMADTPKATISAFKNKGKKVICYFSAGSWEAWRDDRNKIPSAAIGKVMDGWPDEKWIDTRNSGVRNLMKARIATAKSKGCDGVDPDNIDGYNNDSGFPLTEADAVSYVKFLAQTAHDAGLSFGLKNGGDIVTQVVSVSEYAVNEQCVQYTECDLHQPFIKAGKPVFHIEYTEKEPAPAAFSKKVCSAKNAKGFSTLIKHFDLTAWTETCHAPQANAARRHRH